MPEKKALLACLAILAFLASLEDFQERRHVSSMRIELWLMQDEETARFIP